MGLLSIGVEAVERGFVPDAFTRLAIRNLCRARLREATKDDDGSRTLRHSFMESMRNGPVAPVPEKANEQHYELPAEFFTAVLGRHRKYSCCYWPHAACSLGQAEEAALDLTCQNAQLEDGQEVLELGCGWGSLSLWMAQRYPNSRITAVSNSASQRQFIEGEAATRRLANLRVVTADMNDFHPPATYGNRGQFDRIVSVEMFEHMRNYEVLLERIASWLRADGKLLVHVFCHRELSYPFDVQGTADWMARYFFTGGIMPSRDLLQRFDQHLRVVRDWTWNGNHYRRTAEAWLANLDARKTAVIEILASAYGEAEARRWFERWRVFFLAVSELFGYGNGQEWHVSQYLLEQSSLPVS